MCTSGSVLFAVATLTLPGEVESGDRHLVVPTPIGALIGVVDGLGHGMEAALASEAAVKTLHDHAEEPLISLVKRCHEVLKPTRGAVMSLACFNAKARTLSWISIGNVGGVLLRPSSNGVSGSESILMRCGTVGCSLPELKAPTVPVSAEDLLIFATDGIRGGFERDVKLKAPLQEIADSICTKHNKGTDDALVLVARFCEEAA